MEFFDLNGSLGYIQEVDKLGKQIDVRGTGRISDGEMRTEYMKQKTL